MENILATIISETSGYRPIVYGVITLVVLGLIQKATKRWFNIDFSTEGGLLGLVFLITVIAAINLAMNEKEIPLIFTTLIVGLMIGFIAKYR